MAYEITLEQVDSITDVECAFATVRLLPEMDDIPAEFFAGNLYTALAQALFHGAPLPPCSVDLNEGVEPEKLNRCVRAHLMSFQPKHEHKIAGVGFMISKLCTLIPEAADGDQCSDASAVN